MHNLEHIAHQQVYDATTSYPEWRKQLRPRYHIVWRDIALGYAGLLLTIFFYLWLTTSSWPFILLKCIAAALLFGFLLAYLSLFIHEAAHYQLHPNKKQNDRFAGIFLCLLFGLEIRTYRKIHWQHHKHLGTPSDSETSYFNALTPQFLVESATGIHLWRVMKNKNSSIALPPEMRRSSLRWLAAGGILNACIVLAMGLFVHWSLAVAWVIGMLGIFPFLATLRQILEHRDELAAAGTDFTTIPHGKVTRLFTTGFLSRSFGAAGFNRHMIHHWDPQMSYTRFGEVEDFLLRSAATKDLVRQAKTSYWKTFKKLFVK